MGKVPFRSALDPFKRGAEAVWNKTRATQPALASIGADLGR